MKMYVRQSDTDVPVRLVEDIDDEINIEVNDMIVACFQKHTNGKYRLFLMDGVDEGIFDTDKDGCVEVIR